MEATRVCTRKLVVDNAMVYSVVPLSFWPTAMGHAGHPAEMEAYDEAAVSRLCNCGRSGLLLPGKSLDPLEKTCAMPHALAIYL